MLLALNSHCLLVCCLCHSCKSQIKRNLELRTTHRKPIELKKRLWIRGPNSSKHIATIGRFCPWSVLLFRIGFSTWNSGLGKLATSWQFFPKSVMLSLHFWNSLHVSELCAPWCCCSCFSVIVLCHFILRWLCFVACQFALGISARGCFPEFDVSCFVRLVLSFNVDNDQATLHWWRTLPSHHLVTLSNLTSTIVHEWFCNLWMRSDDCQFLCKLRNYMFEIAALGWEFYWVRIVGLKQPHTNP